VQAIKWQNHKNSQTRLYTRNPSKSIVNSDKVLRVQHVCVPIMELLESLCRLWGAFLVGSGHMPQFGSIIHSYTLFAKSVSVCAASTIPHTSSTQDWRASFIRTAETVSLELATDVGGYAES
jgi:hypothetical protein